MESFMITTSSEGFLPVQELGAAIDFGFGHGRGMPAQRNPGLDKGNPYRYEVVL